MLITEQKFLPLLDGLTTGVPAKATYVVDSDEWAAGVAAHRGLAVPEVEIDASAPFLLIKARGRVPLLGQS